MIDIAMAYGKQYGWQTRGFTYENDGDVPVRKPLNDQRVTTKKR